MTARTHDLAAITALTMVFIAMPTQSVTLATIIVAIFANLVGGITPDIDQPTAPFWRNLPVGKYLGKIFDKMLGGHRFITHSILGLIIFGYLSKLLLVFLRPVMTTINADLVWWAFMVGMISHLVMDTLTKEGVPWLLPIPIKFGIPPFRKWRVTTGEWVESRIVFTALIIVNIFLYVLYYQEIIYFIQHNVL